MSVILNYAKAMPDNITFDVVYFLNNKDNSKTRQADIEALGGRVFKIDPPSPKDLLTGKMNGFFAEHKNEWSALHIHCPHFAIFIAPYAKRAGIKKIAMHCHSTWYSLKPENNFRNKMLYKAGSHMVDKKFACGKAAGRFWYGSDNKFTVLPNAVDAKILRFNEEVREQKRQELGISDKLVVGHLGRVTPPQKNHEQILKVFAKLKERCDNSVLLLAGAIENEALGTLARELGIYDSVSFLGNRSDVPELLQAFDVFLFPSLWEGLPVSIVEAQAAGLPVLMSTAVTDEVCATDRIESLSLDESTDVWADRLYSLASIERSDTYEQIKSHGWDIFDCGQRLAGYYFDEVK